MRDEVVAHLRAQGANAEAWRGMPSDAYAAAAEHALDWEPTHLCEMGADLTAALESRGQSRGSIKSRVRASLEATGSGITRLMDVALSYPVFNWTICR